MADGDSNDSRPAGGESPLHPAIIPLLVPQAGDQLAKLRRLIRRMCNGLARTGSYTGHGSGEVMIGFTTANRVPTKGLRREEEELRTLTAIPEETINRAFLAAAEAEEEAILNSMAAAGETRGLKGEYYRSLSDILSQEGEIH